VQTTALLCRFHAAVITGNSITKGECLTCHNPPFLPVSYHRTKQKSGALPQI